MSFQAMTWATEQELPAMQKIVLLMMANRTNHDTGLCFPSHDKLAKECGMSKRSMIDQIEKIERAGLVKVFRSSDERGLKSVNKYRLNINKKSSATDSLPSATDSLPSATDSLPSATDSLWGSATDAHETVSSFNQSINQKDNQVITTRPENFENSGTKLNAVQYEVYVWACGHEYWHKATTSEDEFLKAYCSPKGGMRRQFENRNNVEPPLIKQPTKNQPPINPFAEQLKRENEAVIDSTATHIHQQQIEG